MTLIRYTQDSDRQHRIVILSAVGQYDYWILKTADTCEGFHRKHLTDDEVRIEGQVESLRAFAGKFI